MSLGGLAHEECLHTEGTLLASVKRHPLHVPQYKLKGIQRILTGKCMFEFGVHKKTRKCKDYKFLVLRLG